MSAAHLVAAALLPSPYGMAKAVFGGALQEIWDPEFYTTTLPGLATGSVLARVGTPTRSNTQGKPTIDCSAGNYLVNLSYALALTGARPWFVLTGRVRTNNNSQHMVNLSSGANVNQRVLYNDSTLFRFITTGFVSVLDKSQDTTLHNWCGGSDAAGASLRMDGLSEMVNAADTAALLLDGTHFGVGNNPAGTAPTPLTLACLLQLSTRPTAAQWTAWRNYARRYWNTP